MRTHFTKPLWFIVSIVLCLVLIVLVATSCEDTKTLPKLHTVNFMGEEVNVESQSIEHGMRATKPENPVRESYDFGGWFTDNGTFADEWDFKIDIITQDTTLYVKWEENILPNYPIDILFTEYSLVGSSCQWANLNYDDNIIVIKSNEQLANHINCLEGNYTEIDFSKYTLLLVSGTTPNGIVEISNRLLQLSANEYKLDVEILLDESEVEELWITALIVNKLSKESDIELVTILKH